MTMAGLLLLLSAVVSFVTAVVAWPASSSTSSWTGCPRTPPFLLIVAMAAFAAFTDVVALAPSTGEVNGVMSRTRNGWALLPDADPDAAPDPDPLPLPPQAAVSSPVSATTATRDFLTNGLLEVPEQMLGSAH